MAKFAVSERDLKTVRETERTATRRFNRSVTRDGFNYSALVADLRELHRRGNQPGFTVFYFAFTFTIKDLDTDDLGAEMNRYILERLAKQFKGRFTDIEEAEGDLRGWRVFTTTFKNRADQVTAFLSSLEIFFDAQVFSKFNASIDHDIILTSVSVVFKKLRRSKRPRKGVRSKRKRSRTRLRVYQVRARKVKRHAKRRRSSRRVKSVRGLNRVKSSRRAKTAARKRSKKFRRVRH